jgi:hypothetical protein
MAATNVNRFLLVLCLVAVIACGVIGNIALRERHRAERAEQRLAAVTGQVTASNPTTSTRTFRASNGVVLTAADLDRIDARSREIAKYSAEMEYVMKRTPLPNLRSRAQ